MQLKQDTELQNGKYRIIRVLGQGGFGITYLAEHTMLDKMVAIKEFFPKDYCDRDETTSHLTIGTKNSIEIVEMLKTKFIKEARNISKLHHNNIITIHDIFQENDTAYYVMEYVDGLSLSELIKQKGAMTEAIALGYIRKIADAVGYMHSLSMNHLDLKPANIMIRECDNEPVLIDFGLSKQYDASGGQTSTTPVGISHGYAPIEQYRPGGVSTFTPQTDIYALGATLYTLLSGNVPPHYSEIIEEGLPKLPSSISQQCFNAIEHAMEIKKNNRPESISIFLNELPFNSNDQSRINEKTGIEKTKEKNTSDKKPKKATAKRQIKKETKSDETQLLENSNATVTPSAPNKSDDYVDLGLSVKWCNRNYGAGNPESLGYLMTMEEYRKKVAKSHRLPNINEFQELLDKCTWEPKRIGRSIVGYNVRGNNGNSIYIPIVEVQSRQQMVPLKEWRLLSKEQLMATIEEFQGRGIYRCLISDNDKRFSTSIISDLQRFRFVSSD